MSTLEPEEVQWAARVEHACIQDYLGAGGSWGQSSRAPIATHPQDTQVLADFAIAASRPARSDPVLPLGIFHAVWVNSTTGTWGPAGATNPRQDAERPDEPGEDSASGEMEGDTASMLYTAWTTLLAARSTHCRV